MSRGRPIIVIFCTGLMAEFILPWVAIWLSNIFFFDIPTWSLWLLFGGPPAISLLAMLILGLAGLVKQRPAPLRSTRSVTASAVRVPCPAGWLLEHNEQREHGDRCDHQQLAIVDISNDLCLQRPSSANQTGLIPTTATRRNEGLMGNDAVEKILSIVADQFEIDRSKLTLVTSFIDDLNANSLDAIELIIAFEDAFDVMIPDNAAETIVTVQDAVDFIEQQKEMQRPSLPGAPYGHFPE
jgi:acyl carrier protein